MSEPIEADADSRAMWSELERAAELHFPRLVSRFGRCPSCRQGATAAIGWGPITWSICEHCRTRWPAGRRLLPAVRDRRLLRQYLAALAGMTQF